MDPRLQEFDRRLVIEALDRFGRFGTGMVLDVIRFALWWCAENPGADLRVRKPN